MNRRCLTAACIMLSMTFGTALPVFAKLHPAQLGLNATGTTCDTAKKGTYTYTARWRASPAASYTVHTGNQCRVSTQVCGTALSTGCKVTCDAIGACSAPLNACIATAGAAGQWVKVLGSDGGWQQITASSPGKCS